MIFYVASYPRSGNALLRSLISMNWDTLVTPDGVPTWEAFARDYAKFKVSRKPETPHLVDYFWKSSPHPRHMIAPGYPLSLVQRRALAASEIRYFIKTHEWPLSHYVEGECVIQIVRHPGDALLSYVQLMRDHSNQTFDLPDLINGHVGYGSWAGYHDAWSKAPVPRTVFHFEEVRRSPHIVIDRLCSELGFSQPASFRHETHDQAKSRNPIRNPQGRHNQWRELPPETIALMEARLGRTARSLGYEIKPRPALLRFIGSL